MTYRVQWTSPAQRDIGRLPLKVARAILTYVDLRLAENPQRLGKPLGGDLADLYSARSGDYRVLFELDTTAIVLSIVRIAHRAHAYRPR